MDFALDAQSSLHPRVMAVILTVASCLIISTNLLVASALLVLVHRKCCPSMCLVLNLALADTLVGVAITGLATEGFNGNGNNTVSSAGGVRHGNSVHVPVTSPPFALAKSRCLVRMAFITSPCTASIMSMFLISLDRYVAIKMPLHYSQLSGRCAVAGALVALWASSLMVGFLPVMAPQLQTSDYNGFCAFFSVIRQSTIMVIFCVCFFPVLSVFLFIYLDILKIACGHQTRIHQNQVHRASYRGHHVKAMRTVAVLVGCLLVLWCPFFVTCMVQVLCKSCTLTKVLENNLWLLGLSNSLINPLVYAFWQREVRWQLAAMFSCCRGWMSGRKPFTRSCDPRRTLRGPGSAGPGEPSAEDVLSTPPSAAASV